MARLQAISKPSGGWKVAPNLLDYQRERASFSWDAARRELDGLPAGGLNIAHEAVDRYRSSGGPGVARLIPARGGALRTATTGVEPASSGTL